MRKRNNLWNVLALLIALSFLASACGQNAVEVTRVVTEKETVVQKETVVETVRETIIVAGTPEVVEKEATRVVEVEKPVEVVVTATPEPSGISRELVGELEGPTIIRDPEQFPTEFSEAPELAELVAAGELPPVEDRLPVREDLLVYEPLDSIGTYGGVARHGFTGPGDAFSGWKIATGPDFPLFIDPVTAKIIPNVAKDWTISEDGRTIDLFLRRGMRWSDGEPFTADDWMFWWEDIYLDPDLGKKRPELEPGDGPPVVEKVNDYQVRYTFDVPYFFFTATLSEKASQSRPGGLPAMFQPKHYLTQFHAKYVGEEAANQKAQEEGFENWVQLFNNKADWTANIELPSVNPWVQVTSDGGAAWIFDRNPYYWAVDTAGNQLPYMNGWEVSLASNLEVVNLKAIAGEYDIQSRHLEITKLPLLLQYHEQGGYNVYIDPPERGAEYGIEFNQNYEVDPEIGKLLQNTDFRRALSLGIDREQVNQVFFMGMGVSGSGAPASSNPYYPGDEYRTLWSTYEPDKANEMLDALGLDKKDSEGFRLRPDNGERLVLQAVTQSGQQVPYTPITEMIAEDWADIGIYLDILEVDRALADQWDDAGEIPLYVWGNNNSEEPIRSPETLLPTASGSTYGRHYAQWYLTKGEEGLEPPPRMKEAMEMVDQARIAPEEERIRLGKEIWKIHIDEVYAIGVVGQAPGAFSVRVDNVKLRNVPERMINTAHLPYIGVLQTWYFGEE